MRRVTKKLLYLISGFTFIGLYCEFIIYYVVIAQVSSNVLIARIFPKIGKKLYYKYLIVQLANTSEF